MDREFSRTADEGAGPTRASGTGLAWIGWKARSAVAAVCAPATTRARWTGVRRDQSRRCEAKGRAGQPNGETVGLAPMRERRSRATAGTVDAETRSWKERAIAAQDFDGSPGVGGHVHWPEVRTAKHAHRHETSASTPHPKSGGRPPTWPVVDISYRDDQGVKQINADRSGVSSGSPPDDFSSPSPDHPNE